MDEVFMDNYEAHIYSLLPNLHLSAWELEVINLPIIYEDVGKLIDKEQFQNSFYNHCAQLNLPAETYDLEEAFQKASNEWAIDIMLRVADHVIKSFDRDVPLDATNVVAWKDGRIAVDETICKSIHNYENTLSDIANLNI